MAGSTHRSAGSPRVAAAPTATLSVDLEATEVLPAVRVPRSRLAVALAVTMAALPILLLDNFPAGADAADHVEVAAKVTTIDAPVTTAAPTTTALPPATTMPAPIEATIANITVAPITTVPARRPTPKATPAPTTTQAPPTTEAPAPAPSGIYGDPDDPATWERMAKCEASGNWAANTGNGYYGGLQFSVATWERHGGTGYPHRASKATQIEIGKRLQAAEGWGAWPGCSRELGYT